jgi:hypothetical protein
MQILLVCCDENFEDMFAELVTDHELDVISDYAIVKDQAQMFGILQHDSFDLLVLTNMGIPSAVAARHVSMLPEVCTCRAALLTGHVTPEIEELCRRRGVQLVPMPVSAASLMALVDTGTQAVPRLNKASRPASK